MSSSTMKNKDEEESSNSDDSRTRCLIDQIVATDLARQDQKAKLRVTPRGVTTAMKKRPPPSARKSEKHPTSPTQKNNDPQRDARDHSEKMVQDKQREQALRRSLLRNRGIERDSPMSQKQSTSKKIDPVEATSQQINIKALKRTPTKPTAATNGGNATERALPNATVAGVAQQERSRHGSTSATDYNHQAARNDELIKQRAKAPSMASSIPQTQRSHPSATDGATNGGSIEAAISCARLQGIGSQTDKAAKRRAKAPGLMSAIPLQPRNQNSHRSKELGLGSFENGCAEEIKHLQGPHPANAPRKSLPAIACSIPEHGLNEGTAPGKKPTHNTKEKTKRPVRPFPGREFRSQARFSSLRNQHSERTKQSLSSEGSNTSLLDEITKQRERAITIASAVRRNRKPKMSNTQVESDEASKPKVRTPAIPSPALTVPRPVDVPPGGGRAQVNSRSPTRASVSAPIASVEYATSASEEETLSDFEDDNSSDAAYALAMARSSMRNPLENEKQDNQSHGAIAISTPPRPKKSMRPSLAQASKSEIPTKSSRNDVRGAIAISSPPRLTKSIRPSLAPAIDPELPSIPSDEESSEEDVEAHAGIPLVLPGAFAIQGPDQRDSESDCSEESAWSRSVFNSAAIDLERPTTMNAEIFEQYDGRQLPDTEADVADEKVSKRFRFMQKLSCFLFIVGVGAAIWIGLDDFKTPTVSLEVKGWTIVGPHFEGTVNEPRAFFGAAVAVSGGGNRIAVAAPGVDSAQNLNVGQIHIFHERITRDDGSVWEKRGSVEGPGPSAAESMSLAMSKDGTLIAAGYPRCQDGNRVHLYTETTIGTWSTLLNTFTGSDDSWFGHSISMSSDGSVLGIGAPLQDTATGARSGAIHIFRKTAGGVWLDTSKEEILGRKESEYFGWSLDISGNGQFVAVGAPVSEDTTGLVRVYRWEGFKWEQVGQDIGDGGAQLTRFGESTSLSTDGTILAVGARGTAIDTGQVQIHRLINGDWVRDPTLFSGEGLGEGFGTTVSLSRDGNVLAAGGPRSSGFGEESGVVRVFRRTGDQWKQEGSNIGLKEAMSFGSTVALTDRGDRVVVGAPWTPYDSSIFQAGTALVYDRNAPPERN